MRGRFLRLAAIALGVLVLLLGFPVALALAQPGGGPRAKFRRGNEVVVPAGETIPHDLYIVGGSVRVEGRIEGDLFVLGGQVELRGPVANSVTVAGGSVTVASEVGGSVRAAGGTVTVSGPIQKDLLVSAGNFTLEPSARVEQDLLFSAGRTVPDGTIRGGALGTTGNYMKNGVIAGPEKVTLQQAAAPPSLWERLWAEVARYLSLVLFGLLLLWLLPRGTQAAVNLVRERPLPSFGVGILSVIGVIALLIVLFVAMILLALVFGLVALGPLALTTILGGLLSMSVLTFMFGVACVFLADAIVGLALGRLILGWAHVAWPAQSVWALLIGVLLIVLVTAIPLVGGGLNALAILLGLGALVLMGWRRWGPVMAARPAPPLGTAGA